MLGKVVVRVVGSRGALLVKPPIKLIAPARQRIEPIDSLQIDEVIRFLRVLERELRWTAPAVGLRPKVSNLRDSATEKSRHGRRNFLRRNPVHVGVSFVAPSLGGIGLQKNEGDQHPADQPSSELIHSHFNQVKSSLIV